MKQPKLSPEEVQTVAEALSVPVAVLDVYLEMLREAFTALSDEMVDTAAIEE